MWPWRPKRASARLPRSPTEARSSSSSGSRKPPERHVQLFRVSRQARTEENGTPSGPRQSQPAAPKAPSEKPRGAPFSESPSPRPTEPALTGQDLHLARVFGRRWLARGFAAMSPLDEESQRCPLFKVSVGLGRTLLTLPRRTGAKGFCGCTRTAGRS